MTTLDAIWDRLPAFRAVAETEHLPTAAKRMHVTPPALSRSVRLLEEALGQPIFDRVGRRLVLNQAGICLLDAVVEASTRLEVGLAALEEPLGGPLRVSAVGVLTNHFVLPALLQMGVDHPNLSPELALHGTADANDRLARGRLDLAFYYESLTDPRIALERLGSTGAAVYCGRAHPLFGEEARQEQVLNYPFSVPRSGDAGRVLDGWPDELPRHVGLRITTLASNERVALSGRFLTVLPRVVAEPHLKSGHLWCLDAVTLDPIPVYAAWKRGHSVRPAARSLIDAVAAALDPSEA